MARICMVMLLLAIVAVASPVVAESPSGERPAATALSAAQEGQGCAAPLSFDFAPMSRATAGAEPWSFSVPNRSKTPGKAVAACSCSGYCTGSGGGCECTSCSLSCGFDGCLGCCWQGCRSNCGPIT